MKVLHLPNNIASQISVTVRALRAIGVKARGLVLNNAVVQDTAGLETYVVDKHAKNPWLRWRQKCTWNRAFLQAIAWADVVHWYSSARALRWNLDLRYVKVMRRARVVEFWGTEIRNPEVARRDNPFMEEFYASQPDYATERTMKCARTQARFARYGFECLTPGEEIPTYVDRDLFPHCYPTRQRVLLDEYPFVCPRVDNDCPLVVHLPSNKSRKGTETVLNAVERLKGKCRFEFRLVHGVPKREAFDILKQADVVLDQFLLGDHGLAAVESMAMGKPTVCYIKPSLLRRYPEDFAIIPADTGNLVDVLETLLTDAGKRNEIGTKSRAYVEKHHNALKVAQHLVQIYEQLLSCPLE